VVKTWQLEIGLYNIYAAKSFVGPYQRINSKVIP